MLHPEVADAELTCTSDPEQYDGRLADGRYFYFRYRWGVASLAVGVNQQAVVGRQDVGMAVGGAVQGEFNDAAQRDQVFAELLRKIEEDGDVSRKKTPPTWRECLVLHLPEAEELRLALTGAGYLAETKSSGICRRDAAGEHWHAAGVTVTLTPEQARKLAGLS